MHDFIYYLGLILAVGGIGFFIFSCYKVNKKYKTTDSFLALVKENLLYIIGPVVTFLLGFILLNIAFYIDEATISYLENNSINVLWYHQLETYLFGILFVLSLFSFLYSLIVKLYFDKYQLSKKRTHLWFGLSILLTVVTFTIYSEGNAPYLQYPLCNALYIGGQRIKFINVYRYGNTFSDGLVIYFYAIFILSGACLVLYVVDYKLYKQFGFHDLVTNTFLIAFPSGIIGARLWYVVLDISKGGTTFIGNNWVNIFNFRDGGLGIMGGAILGIIAGVTQVFVVKYAMKSPRYKNFNMLQAADIIIPCILFAQAIGRLGNFFNNEVFGDMISISYFEWLPTVIKNNMYFLHGEVLSGGTLQSYLDQGVFELPLFFIEFVTNLIGYFFLEYGCRKIFKKYHSDGALAGGYIMWYGFTRVILEPLRYEVDYFSASIYSAWAMVVIGAVVVILMIVNNYVIKRKKLLWYKEKVEVVEETSSSEISSND